MCAAPARGLAEHPARGERTGLGEGGEEETEEAKVSATQPDVDPAEGPRPQGSWGSSASHTVSVILTDTQTWDNAARMPILEVGVKGETQRDAQGLPAQGGGQPFRGPWVGWVGCCLWEQALSKWKPGLRNWPGHSGCTAPGKTHCSLKGAPILGSFCKTWGWLLATGTQTFLFCALSTLHCWHITIPKPTCP